jgi:hypothetical protein
MQFECDLHKNLYIQFFLALVEDSSIFILFSIFTFFVVQDSHFRQEIEQSPELGLLILDAMQEAEIDNTSDRIKKRRRSTEPGTDNISALVPRQVRVGCPYDVMRGNVLLSSACTCTPFHCTSILSWILKQHRIY